MITRFEELLQHNRATTAAVAKATKSKRPLCVQKEGWIERRRKTQKKKRKKNTVSIAEKGGEVWSEIKSDENFLDS